MKSEGAILIICGSFKEIRCSKTDVNILYMPWISVVISLETETSYRKIKLVLYMIPFQLGYKHSFC
jgi:hypothetical protein